MSKTEGIDRLVKELEEANQRSSPADRKVLQDFSLLIEQINSVPNLPPPEPRPPEQTPKLQPISLESINRCFK